MQQEDGLAGSRLRIGDSRAPFRSILGMAVPGRARCLEVPWARYQIWLRRYADVLKLPVAQRLQPAGPRLATHGRAHPAQHRPQASDNALGRKGRALDRRGGQTAPAVMLCLSKALIVFSLSSIFEVGGSPGRGGHQSA